ncbi:universal stress protein [Streptomyces sp. NBC_00576]|uniref:universal stress protein n=1 Tax=Streptomyces sp. NBC_00576 TaxID=2903665 RepID=UPI003FCE21A2
MSVDPFADYHLIYAVALIAPSLVSAGPCTTNSIDTSLESDRAIPVQEVETMLRTIAVGLDGSPESRATSLPVVHSWNPPPYYAHDLSSDLELHTEPARQEAATLTEVLRPWRQKFPAVEVVEESRYGTAAIHLVDASRETSLVVVGHRPRRRRPARLTRSRGGEKP